MTRRRALKSEDVDGFVVAFWDEVKETEAAYEVRLSFDLRLGSERGRLSLHGQAVREDPDGPPHLVGTSDVRWPNYNQQSLHAWLYALAIRLNVACQKELYERTGAFYSSPQS